MMPETMPRPVIDYGARLRAGLLVPSGNSIAEPEIRAMVPAGVSVLVTRLELRGSSETELLHMIDDLEGGARLLADAHVARIVFHCTAVSTFAPHLASRIRERILEATGVSAFATSDAIIAALAAVKARRISLVTPYLRDVHDRECAFLESHGMTVAEGDSLGINTNEEMSRLSTESIAAFVRRTARAEVDAYLLSCTAIRSAGLIAPLELELGRPVITSNQAMIWYLLRSQGVVDSVTGFGSLFGRALPDRT